MKVKYKDQVIEVCEGATFEVVGGKLVITPKEQEFKDGNILFAKDDYINNIVCIYRKDSEKGTGYYCSLSDEYGIEYNNQHWDIRIKFRIATEEEKQKLFDALKKYGKKWNSETKQIEDILKVGDLAIFWNKNKKEAIVSEILETNESGVPYRSTYSWFNNAIKCTSLEQYINFKK